jgi:hypothetical protein
MVVEERKKNEERKHAKHYEKRKVKMKQNCTQST